MDCSGDISFVLDCESAILLHGADVSGCCSPAGSVVFGNWTKSAKPSTARFVNGLQWAGIVLNGAVFAVFVMPVAPFGGAGWRVTSKLHDQFREQIGWQELTEHVAQRFTTRYRRKNVRARESWRGNYGEGGALNLYGPALGLPRAMAGTNSFW